MKDNEIKFGFWNYLTSDIADLSVVKDWKEMGCNLPMSFVYDPSNKKCTKEYMIAMLDECRKYGLKCLIADNRVTFKTLNKLGEKDYRIGVLEAKKDFYNHPAFYGFLVDDEPSMEMEKDYIRAYQILNEEMPNGYHFGNLHPYFSPRVMSKDYGTFEERYQRVWNIVKNSECKLLAYDQYTQCYHDEETKEAGIKDFFLGLSTFLKIGNEFDIPVYPSLLSIGHFLQRSPTEDDIRWQMNVALAMGAKGVIWFYFHHDLIDYGFKVETAPFFGPRAEKTETYNMIRRQQEIFDTRYRKIFDNLDIIKYSYVGKVIEEDKVFSSEDGWLHKVDLWKNDLAIVSYGTLRDSGKKVAILVNGSQEITNCFTIFFNEKDSYSGWLVPGEMIVFDVENKCRLD
ncbi:MAG: hypothetical protein HUJ61_08195 [Bacilli bacterium]|nr:hypothetical protein [Bacilli bacterium]